MIKFRLLRATGATAAASSFHGAASLSTSTATAGGQQIYPANRTLNPSNLHNRNPRNLEQLRIGYKPGGFPLEVRGARFIYWNKLIYSPSSKHISGSVLHHSGRVALTCSSKEWCLRRFLYSTKDTSASRSVGLLLAHRCLEMGIQELYTDHHSYVEASHKRVLGIGEIQEREDRRGLEVEVEIERNEKLSSFYSQFEKLGITLHEPPQYRESHHLNDDYQDERGWRST